jgi:hypothetical protein
MLAAFLVTAPAAITRGAECDKTAASATTIKLEWNSFASEWGQYEIEGCSGVSPKLKLAAGRTYTFDQSHASNWYHPVGFAYIAGGAHTVCKDSDDVEGECPEIGGTVEAAAHTGTPSELQYYVDGAAVTTDESGFGLDSYEPLFFNSQDNWGAQAFKVTLKVPADADYSRLYYFCHIHSGMSAEIEIVDSSATSQTTLDSKSLGGETEASALAIYDTIVADNMGEISEFDEECGTHGSSAFRANAQCKSKHFLCGDDLSTFKQCLESIDCEMHYKMAVSVPASSSKFATFARQMIPHHQNAVQMAKVLLKMHSSDDYPEAGTEDQDMDWAEGLIRNIINVQNAQIQSMQGWLEANSDLSGTSSECYGTDTDAWTKPPDEDDDGIKVTSVIGIAVGCAIIGMMSGAMLMAVAKRASVPAATPTTKAQTEA